MAIVGPYLAWEVGENQASIRLTNVPDNPARTAETSGPVVDYETAALFHSDAITTW